MLNTISYTTWRRQLRRSGVSTNCAPDPLWVMYHQRTLPVRPDILQQFNQIAQQRQLIHAHVLDSANR
jgi:hypothetical protein